MGLFDQLKSEVMGKLTGEEGAAKLPHALLDLIGNQEGGLPGLLDKLKEGGLGEQVASWVGDGPKLPVTAEQIQAALGSDVLGQLAQKTGLDPAAISGQVAEVLPGIVDKLTPHGEVGEHSLLQEGLSAVRKLFG